MNTKRQTVWLVSMLSLMVILSAYYLFTEDVNKSDDLLTDGTTQQQEQVVTDATEAGGAAATTDGINVTEVDKEAASPDGSAAQDVTQKDNAAADTDAISKEDQAVLDKVEATGVSSVFSQLQEKRDTKFNEEYNKVYSVISDTQNEKDAGKAVDQLDQLEEKSAKITGLEEELQKQYNNAAVVPEKNDSYKIVVESEKLERSQADGIMQLVIKELGVTAAQVTVQFIQ